MFDDAMESCLHNLARPSSDHASILPVPMFLRSPILRLAQTQRHYVRVIPEAIAKPISNIMSSSEASEPTGLIANKGLELLTFGTPNGHKISIFLEELKEAYGKDYVFQSVNIMKNTQKEPWYTKLGPNGRIPVLVDHDKGGLAIQEGAGNSIIGYGDIRKERPC
jgi:hypothetical protein